LALLIVGLVAVLSLRDGFSGDQVLFLIYSKAVASGQVFYRDVWDIKQPAIIVFYLIAAKGKSRSAPRKFFVYGIIHLDFWGICRDSDSKIIVVGFSLFTIDDSFGNSCRQMRRENF